ncbi:MAG: hypothetical protein FWG17_06770 [Desulfovibrionaceae bacterium]|nr:hypothetical protein [Desulfovibrionaceae bacterium]
MSFAAARDQYLDTSKSPENPQSSPLMAYQTQRRGICAFEDYLEFAELTVEKSGAGPEGPETPLLLGDAQGEGGGSSNLNYISRRAHLWIHEQLSTSSSPRQDPVLDNQEGYMAGEENLRKVLQAVALEGFSRRIYA